MLVHGPGWTDGHHVGRLHNRRHSAAVDRLRLPQPAANGNGWNNSAVTVTWTCGDGSGSGVVADTVSATVDAEGPNQSATGTCTDHAGNTASATETNIKIDTTEPVTTFKSKSPAGDGWSNTDVVVTWSCTDSGSGVVSPEVSATTGGEGNDRATTGTCEDLAGNTSHGSVSEIKVDKTPPAITYVTRTAANDAGWNNGDVEVTWSCTDDGSGPAATSVTTTVTGEGDNLSADGICTDLAGNTASDTRSGINIDRQAPTITYVARTAANDAGWNNGDVEVTWSCTDDGSGPAATSVTTTVTGEGDNLSADGICTDLAGNTVSDTRSGINIDRQAPTITYVTRTAANDAGWNNGDVEVTWSCTDDGSGPAATSVTTTVTGEGDNLSADGICTDLAGNTASDTRSGINIDRQAPTITYVTRTAANDAGWNNGDVEVTWSCTDDGSGPAATSVTTTVTGEGDNLSADGICTDRAGNTASDTQTGINIDRTKPTVQWDSGPAGSSTHFFGSVPTEPTCTASDTLSGGDECTVSGYGTTVGPHTMTATARDLAGNVNTDTRSYTVAAWTLHGFYRRSTWATSGTR